MSNPTDPPVSPPQSAMAEQGKKEKKKGEGLYLLLIFLMLCSNGAMGWLWWKDKGSLQVITVEKETIAKDAEIVKQELIALGAQYENLKVTNKEMQAEIDTRKEDIVRLQRELEKHKDNAWIIAKLKKETETLRRIMQHFVVEIDSLNTLNKNIIADREKVRVDLNSEKEKNTLLIKEKESLQETVNMASMLKIVGLYASGIAEKKGGKKESDTKKAKRTDKIKIAFTLAENLVAKKGDRVIYARIISPDGKEMTQADDSLHVFKFGKSKGFWATKKNVNYANENTEVIMYAHAKKGDLFSHGKYIIEVNTDGATLGNTTLELE
ncbi:MAG: hypothetical protein EPN85_06585 [Bacteroidetes bacterium]|nr:MAG: hypothetical protein EPN85_06585 [Bacteroidota bacterium]